MYPKPLKHNFPLMSSEVRMNVDISSTHKSQMASQNSCLEIVNTEKQLLALIHSKGLLNGDVLELYRKVRSGYENIILSSSDLRELQEAEFLLWKLHYKQIDEFRKRVRQNSEREAQHDNINSQTNSYQNLEGFRSFLSEAIVFYRNLIVKVRTTSGFPAEVLLEHNCGISFSGDVQKLHKSQYMCHRLLVCLGDLARYAESCKKPEACKWSVAVSYYLEATRTWPDSGNPHNQLALLATYVGDAFLALYHCIRSLAVKEPFPDSWNNLTLLFEENRISHLTSLPSEAQFDFSNPAKKISLQKRSQAEDACAGKTDLWPLFVSMTSLFFVRSSSEDFASTLALTVGRLEALLALDNAELCVALESYQHLDSSRKGPYRAVQLVCMLIFTVHILTEGSERKEIEDNEEFAKKPFALAFMFICMGRLSETCLKSINCSQICSFLPAILVFLEWLEGSLDQVEVCVADGRVMNSVSYFFGALADLLNQVDETEREIAPDYAALWEDHEVRGFGLLSRGLALVDFKNQFEGNKNFESNNLLRYRRTFHSARRIAEKLNGSQNWILYDKVERKFDSGKATKTLDQGGEELSAFNSCLRFTKAEPLPVRSRGEPKPDPQPVTTEEEEVIVFKPISRHNSAPLYISPPNKDQHSLEGSEIEKTSVDEFLRRATSLCIDQDPDKNDSFSFCSNISESEPQWPFKQQEPQLKDLSVHPTGPPSLSAWFLNRESSKTEEEKGPKDCTKQKVSPIQEIASASLSNISINETKYPEDSLEQILATNSSSSPPVSPLPSAPLLPEDAAWYSANSRTCGYTDPRVVGGQIDFSPGVLGLVNGYPLLGMSSSEWLYHYRNSQNPPASGSFYTNGVFVSNLYDQWGNRFISSPTAYAENARPSLVYGAEGQRRDKIFHGYQRPYPYLCGVGMELRTEKLPLLQQLKEREWQLQPDSQMNGSTFMG